MVKTKLDPKEKPKKNLLEQLLKIKIEPQKNETLNEEDVFKLIFKSYEIIEKIENKKIDDKDGKKIYLMNLKNIIQFLEKEYMFLKQDDLDREYLIKLKEIVTTSLNAENFDNLDINVFKNDLDKITNICTMLRDKETIQEEFSIEEIDNLYKNLYDAYSKKDLRLITLYRGRIINLLKQKNNIINTKYQEIELLAKINRLSNGNLTDEIIELIKQAKESKLKKQLEYFINEPTSFNDSFKRLYQTYQVEKILFYKDALSIELKQQGKQLDKRYETEFLDKKITLLSPAKTLPNAIAISIKKISNTISEIKEAKNNRKKIAKIIEAFGDTGKLIATPLIYLGKFAASNWYSLYLLYKGGLEIKEQSQTMQNEVPTSTTEVLKPTNETKPKKPLIHQQPVLLEDEIVEQSIENIENPSKTKPNLNVKPVLFEEPSSEIKPIETPIKKPDLNIKPISIEQEDIATEVKENTSAAQSPEEVVKENTSVEQSPEENVIMPEVTPEILNPYTHLQGGQISTIMPPGPAYNANIYEQLRYGVITPDTQVRVSYWPADISGFERLLFWNRKTELLTLREIQEIFNWWPDANLDEIYGSYCKGRGGK